jgi:hypothetical protein
LGFLRRSALTAALVAAAVACSGLEFQGATSSVGGAAGAGIDDAGTDAPSTAQGGAGGRSQDAQVGSGASAGETGLDGGAPPEVDAGCQGMLAGCSCVQGKCGPGLACSLDDECVEMPAPVAHWRFEGDALDASGNGFDGVANDSVSFESGAAHFDGQSSFVDVSAFAAKFNEIAGEMTVYARVKSTDWSTNPILLGSGGDGESEETNGLWLTIVNDKASIGSETGAGEDHVVSVGEALPLDTWVDLVFLVNWESLDVYQDGEYVEYRPFTRIEPLDAHAQIGARLPAVNVLNGDLDDVQVYDVLLDDEQISALPSTR